MKLVILNLSIVIGLRCYNKFIAILTLVGKIERN